jgi:hypothetical protein
MDQQMKRRTKYLQVAQNPPAFYPLASFSASFLEIKSQGRCRNYIASTAALLRAKRTSQPQQALRSRTSSDMDIMTAFRDLGPNIYTYMTMNWVKGHQDWYLCNEKLSMQAKMNMRADELAENYRTSNQELHQSKALSQPFQASKYSSSSTGTHLHSHTPNGSATKSPGTT